MHPYKKNWEEQSQVQEKFTVELDTATCPLDSSIEPRSNTHVVSQHKTYTYVRLKGTINFEQVTNEMSTARHTRRVVERTRFKLAKIFERRTVKKRQRSGPVLWGKLQLPFLFSYLQEALIKSKK